MWRGRPAGRPRERAVQRRCGSPAWTLFVSAKAKLAAAEKRFAAASARGGRRERAERAAEDGHESAGSGLEGGSAPPRGRTRPRDAAGRRGGGVSGWPSPRNSSLRPEGSPAAMAMEAGQQTPARRCRAPRCGFRVVEILSWEGGSGPAAGAEGEGLLQHGQWMPWSTLQQPFPQRHAPLQDGAHHHDGHAGPDRLEKRRSLQPLTNL